MRNYVDIIDDCTPKDFYTLYTVQSIIIKVPGSCPLKGFERTSSRLGVRRSDQMASHPKDGFDFWQVSIQYKHYSLTIVVIAICFLMVDKCRYFVNIYCTVYVHKGESLCNCVFSYYY
jgi:hypothetical protein